MLPPRNTFTMQTSYVTIGSGDGANAVTLMEAAVLYEEPNFTTETRRHRETPDASEL